MQESDARLRAQREERALTEALPDRSLGNEDPNVRDACEFILEHAEKACEAGTLSEGAYKQAADMAMASFNGVSRDKYSRAVEMVMILRQANRGEGPVVDMENEHLALQRAHLRMQHDFLGAQIELRNLWQRDALQQERINKLLTLQHSVTEKLMFSVGLLDKVRNEEITATNALRQMIKVYDKLQDELKALASNGMTLRSGKRKRSAECDAW